MLRFFCIIAAVSVSAVAHAQTINACTDAKGKVTLTESSCAKLGLHSKSTSYYQPSSQEDLEVARREREITLEKGRALDQRSSQQATPRTTTTVGIGTPQTMASLKRQECTSIDNEIASIKVQQRSYSYPYLTERKRKLEDLRFEKQCHHSD